MTSTINGKPQCKRERQVSHKHIKEPPKIFKDVLHMIVALWKMLYPNKFKFLPQLIVLFLPLKNPFGYRREHNITISGRS
jgi:hypothetical protein